MKKMSLRALRINANISQAKVAGILGVGNNTVSRYELGYSKPRIDKLLKMCELYGCTIDDIDLGDINTTERERCG